MTALMNRRRPFLTATRMLSNQTFRDLYRNATLDPEQRFRITNLTILFTDLMGSTALYARVGDFAAFDLVRHHFSVLLTAVSAEGGAVVKTIGDAVMATFPAPPAPFVPRCRCARRCEKSTVRAATRTSPSISACTRARALR